MNELNSYRATENWRSSIIALIPFLIFLAVEELFMPISIGPLKEAQHPYIAISNNIYKVLNYVALLVAFFYFYRLEGYLRNVFFIVTIYFTFLVFESLYRYNSFIQYNHVVEKIAHFYVFFAFIVFLKNYSTIKWRFIMNLLIAAIIMKILLDPGLLSLQSFLNHDRGLSSQVIVILTLPFFYFLNYYLLERKTIDLIKVIFLLFILIYFQHRTIWVVTGLGILLDFFLMSKFGNVKFSKFIPTVLTFLFFIFFSLSLILTYSHKINEKVGQEVQNILDPTDDATANWRLIQFESYVPFIEQNLIFGMRFSGFELPNQFYHPDAPSQTYFEDGTGHHFHNHYIDILFYFGLLGLLLYILIMVYPIALFVKHRNDTTINFIQISLYSVYLPSFIFNLAWPQPTFILYVGSLLVLSYDKNIRII